MKEAALYPLLQPEPAHTHVTDGPAKRNDNAIKYKSTLENQVVFY